jgi:hypothetical protein
MTGSALPVPDSEPALAPATPDLASVHDALRAVSEATDPDSFRRANGKLAARLDGLARSRGRSAVPKPISTSSPPPRRESSDYEEWTFND